MMICPQTFYDAELKGKTAEQILAVICRLRQEIGRLKGIVEHPRYKPEIQPSECVRIACNREYLQKAKKAYAEAGGVYVPSAAEKRAQDIQDNIDNISKVQFSLGSHFVGWEDRAYTVKGDKMRMCAKHLLIQRPDISGEEVHEIDKADFLDRLKGLSIGEWRKKYSPERYGLIIADGISWELNIYFSNRRKPISIHGDNAYPYNFDRLLEIFEIDGKFGISKL